MNPKQLIKEAKEAQKRAKAPYSKYPVGAALLLPDDKVIYGCNIESKAYPTTLCAERIAIFSAISQGYTKFHALALITQDGGTPCGGCRQIMHEYLGNIPIYIANNSMEKYKILTIKELLPHPFG